MAREVNDAYVNAADGVGENGCSGAFVASCRLGSRGGVRRVRREN